jgi:hypothetical protein
VLTKLSMHRGDNTALLELDWLRAERSVETIASPVKAGKPSPGLEGVNDLAVVFPVGPRLMIGVSSALTLWD